MTRKHSVNKIDNKYSSWTHHWYRYRKVNGANKTPSEGKGALNCRLRNIPAHRTIPLTYRKTIFSHLDIKRPRRLASSIIPDNTASTKGRTLPSPNETSIRKNKIAQVTGEGIWLMASGYTMNISPGPNKV